MNNIILPITDLMYSVERPIIYDVIKDIMLITNISSKSSIKIYGEDDRGLQKNSTIDEDITQWNLYPYDDKVIVEVSEEFNTDRILSTPVMQVLSVC